MSLETNVNHTDVLMSCSWGRGIIRALSPVESILNFLWILRSTRIWLVLSHQRCVQALRSSLALVLLYYSHPFFSATEYRYPRKYFMFCMCSAKLMLVSSWLAL